MVRPFNPYSVYTAKFLQLLDTCRNKKDPAWWLYTNNARSTLFMLESISRLWFKSHGDNETQKWLKTFKKLEDALGVIDYYDVILKEFSKGKNIPEIQMAYFERKRDKAVSKLNEKLIEKDFYKKFMVGSSKPGVLSFNNKHTLLKLEGEIKFEIMESARFFEGFPKGFNNMELQVHELRRKLRWISIYAQSLSGVVILKDPKTNYKWEKEFVTKFALESPYNKLAVKKGLKHYIPLNKTAFLALTTVIEELGRIKDKGLALEALAKSIEKTTHVKNETAVALAKKQLNSKITIEELLAEAHKLLMKFFNTYKIHKALIDIP